MKKMQVVDIVLMIILSLLALAVIIPVLNVIAISLSSYDAYLSTDFLLFPKSLTTGSYRELLGDSRMRIGFKTSLIRELFGLPMVIFFCTSMAYGLSRKNYPGRKIIFVFVLFTMLFSGGIVPLYLVLGQLRLRDTIWAITLTSALNTFYMILIYNYFNSLPDSLIESAHLDGAGEWTILFKLVLPLSKPILAAVMLFSAVDFWNEWYNAMIFIKSTNLIPLQLALRNIMNDSSSALKLNAGSEMKEIFTMGKKMAAVIITMLPVVCIFPFLQRFFAKGIMVGAVKS